MKIFINYLHFTRDNAQKLIRNDSNNDHWPTVNDYIDTLKEWVKTVDQQQQTVKDYLKYLSTIKVGQESFVIRIVNDINTKLKTLNAKDKKDQPYLERVKSKSCKIYYK